MSERDRAELRMRATIEGERAFAKGTSRDECPYKVSSWGVGAFWQMGWDRAALAQTEER